MIISRTPFRISFFGGGTDYPAWFKDHGGAVIGGAIDKYGYVSIRHLPPFFEHKHRVVWSKIELVEQVDDIQHPAVRAVLAEAGAPDGVEISYNADLPARSGLGTSSSFTVGLLNALKALDGNLVSKQELAGEAIRMEQEVMKEAVGSQDQVWAAYGGLNRVDFHEDGSFEVSPLILPKGRRDEIKGSLMLFFTGFSRDAATIAKAQIENFPEHEKNLIRIREMVDEAMSIFSAAEFSIGDFGNLLSCSWEMKRGLAESVTTPQVDEIYQAGIEAGASGGKLLGAGGGGFILFAVEPGKRTSVQEKLKELIHVSIDFDTGGSKIVVFEPDDFSNSR